MSQMTDGCIVLRILLEPLDCSLFKLKVSINLFCFHTNLFDAKLVDEKTWVKETTKRREVNWKLATYRKY